MLEYKFSKPHSKFDKCTYDSVLPKKKETEPDAIPFR